MKIIPAAVADKLGKIIPRLASTHDAEVLATVAAIRRTLDGAGLDLHDLADSVAGAVDRIPARTEVRTPYARERQRTPAEWAESNRKMQEAEDAKRAKRTPWATFKRLTHFGRCEQLDRMANSVLPSRMSAADRAAFDALRAKIVQRPHEILGRAETNLFNKLMRALWAADQNRKEAA